MSEDILWQFEEQTWIQMFLNARIVGNGATQLSHVEFKNQNASNAMVPTSLKTIANLGGVARWMTGSTLQGWKQRKENHVLIHSNARTVKEITKRIPTNVCFGDIGLIGSGNKKNMLRSIITDPSWSVLRWMVNLNYNCEKPQNSFAKCSQKLPHCQHPPWDPKSVQYHFHPRISLVRNS